MSSSVRAVVLLGGRDERLGSNRPTGGLTLDRDLDREDGAELRPVGLDARERDVVLEDGRKDEAGRLPDLAALARRLAGAATADRLVTPCPRIGGVERRRAGPEMDRRRATVHNTLHDLFCRKKNDRNRCVSENIYAARDSFTAP